MKVKHLINAALTCAMGFTSSLVHAGDRRISVSRFRARLDRATDENHHINETESSL
jgi:hypothetical protein